MALARIGANRLTSYDDDTSVEAIHCRLHYEQTRDSLLQSHWWRFAVKRAELSEDESSPDFGWDYQFVLPADYLSCIGLYDTVSSYSLEGSLLLTNDGSADLVYIAQVTDVTTFSPMFVEVLVLQLALKLVMPLSQDKVLRRELQEEYAMTMARAKTNNKAEMETIGREDLYLWNDARLITTYAS